MVYVITLDPGTEGERLFVVPTDKYDAILADLDNYCDSLDVSGPHEFIEIQHTKPSFRERSL